MYLQKKHMNLFNKNFVYNYFIYTQRNDPIAAKGKSFWENPLDAKRLSFGIKYVALGAKNSFFASRLYFSYAKTLFFTPAQEEIIVITTNNYSHN